ncbi:hypothetical protein [Actinoplanes solisilvae]|uniref:hypothetical protein n=1 Tax=Actinoplanes solisilvae TaxID=2486853 RepID=UPI000FDB5479|nr:hypothetical protein [Actinoplanes solisilvae]
MAGRGQIVSLGIALGAAALLLGAPKPEEPPPPPPSVALAWPAAQKATITADLPDGTAYEPLVFLDARTSIGSAPSRDEKFLRLVKRGPGDTVRELRRLPLAQNPSFLSPAVSGDTVVWAENTSAGQEMWAADSRTGRQIRKLTADTGDSRFYQSQYDLVVAGERVHWVAAEPSSGTEIRSVALTGGPVEVRTVPGNWALTDWPWMVDGLADMAGAGRMRNLVTGEERPMPLTRRGTTACTPLWCRAVSLDADGYPKIEIVRTDGTDRQQVARRTARTIISDVAVLGRFEVYSQVTAASELTGRDELLIFDIETNRHVRASPEAGDVRYRNGVLWWSAGTANSFVRHVLDLRTV